MPLVPRKYIDPYGQQLYRPSSSSKSIFKDQNLYSNLIRSLDINKLTNIFQNDTIIDGLKLTNFYLSNNDRTINFTLSPGRIVQDNTLVDILEDVNLSIDIFSVLNITNTNNANNYFELSGDHTINFPNNKQFAIFNSNTSSFNNPNWVVQESVYNSNTNRTIIYTFQSITTSDDSGEIVVDNFPDPNDSLDGSIILTSRYQFQETMDDNSVEFIPVYINSDSEYSPGFDTDTFRIIYSLIYITKDLDNFIIDSNALSVSEDSISVYYEGKSYYIHDTTDAYLDNLDGGVIA